MFDPEALAPDDKRLQGIAAFIRAHQHEGGGIIRPVHAENRLVADDMQLPDRSGGPDADVHIGGCLVHAVDAAQHKAVGLRNVGHGADSGSIGDRIR